ncbi:hypothetical protein MES5069_420074 [Mesorhizobium escarrei]|uniref:Uncharacterized protein n=1 Tax=Mesorhizobium escarrei TaxID=666018 RepID=A0ABM9E603_9HYPH|nr:hypothetical protein MES5069_420074 [Mesorhizobium escarrei]
MRKERTLYSTGSDFAYGLVWEQFAGRVSGSARGVHVRPFYFSLLLLPVVLLPWGLSPGLWAARPWARLRDRNDVSQRDFRTLQFLAVWCMGELPGIQCHIRQAAALSAACAASIGFAKAPRHTGHQAPDEPPLGDRAGDRPHQGRLPNGPQLSRMRARRCRQRHPSRNRLQLLAAAQLVQVAFGAAHRGAESPGTTTLGRGRRRAR